jgi:hypothetical protein
MTKIKTQTVTCVAGVTVNPFVGTSQNIGFTGAVGVVKADVVSLEGDTNAADGLVVAGGDYVTNGAFQSNVISMAPASITAASIAAGGLTAAVWDTLTSGHTTSGTFGGSLNSASSAGDPWNTPIPGAYAAGTAGHRVGTAIPDIAPGAANGLLIAGSNAATTFALLTSTGALTVGSLACGAFAVGAVTMTSLGNSGATSLTGAVTGTNASNDLRGIRLGATGLDSLSVGAPSGPAGTFREMVVQTWRRFFKKSVKNDGASTIVTYADDNSTPITTQTFTSAAGTDSINSAS